MVRLDGKYWCGGGGTPYSRCHYLGIICGFLFSLVILLVLAPGRVSWAGTWTSVFFSQAGDGAQLYAVCEDSNGRVWAGGGEYRSNQAYFGMWNGTSWVDKPRCPYLSTIYALTVDRNGHVWAAGYQGRVAKWGGNTWVDVPDWPYSDNISGLVTAPDGSIWAVGDNGRAARWNGSQWVSLPGTGISANEIAVDKNGQIWVVGQSVKRWNGTGWTDIGVPAGWSSVYVRGVAVAPDNSIYIVACRSGAPICVARWNGSWQVIGDISGWENAEGICIAPDGSVWVAGEKNTGDIYPVAAVVRWNGAAWVNEQVIQDPCGYIRSNMTIATDGAIWVVGHRSWAYGDYGRAWRYTYGPEMELVPTPQATGQLVVKPKFDGELVANAIIQVSTDGSSFSDLYTSTRSTCSFTPTNNQYWFRIKWGRYFGRTGVWETRYTSLFGPVPAIVGNPSVAVKLSRVTWDSVRGRSRVSLSWSSLTNATNYRIYVFDGFQYRSRDLGNVTSWDSHTARIFPFPAELTENNSVSSDLFRWDASGLDLEDDPRRLYRTTQNTSYDDRTNYWFRIVATNSWMETDFNAASAIVTPTLPNATDAQPPSGLVSVTSREGIEKTYDRMVCVSVNVQDTFSGIRRVELSNDGTSYTIKYEAPLNPDNGTGVESYVNTFEWDVPLGAGTKVVYVRITDAVGNQKVVTDTIALAEDMLPPSVTLTINGGAESTTGATVTLTLTVQDNASTASQMRMRFSNDGNLWSSWEPFQQMKSWNITSTSYGGTSSAGIKKVYAQVCDQAQNVALAVAEIGYNPTPPSGSVTIVGGASGTWNGQLALFTKSDSPVLNLNYSDASQVRFDPGTGVWGDWESYKAQKVVYLVKSQGACRLRVQVKDAYGVAGTPQEFIVVVDPIPPTISTLRGLAGATATRTSSVTLEITASDNLPGTLQYRYQINGGSWTAYANLTGGTITVSGLSSGVNVINVSVKDLAGNASQKSVTIFKI